MKTIEQTRLPALTPAEHGTLNDAFKLPDVSAVAVENLDSEDLVHFVVALGSQLDSAKAKFEAICAPITDAIAQARAMLFAEIEKRGGTALPHDTFDVHVEQTTKRDKRIDVLRGLQGLLPDDEFNAAVYEEVKREWKADLRKLDVAARKYGGEIAKIVEDGSPRVDVGIKVLVIEPKPAALKAVS